MVVILVIFNEINYSEVSWEYLLDWKGERIRKVNLWAILNLWS